MKTDSSSLSPTSGEAAHMALMLRAYEVLADVRHDWPGRSSMEGQSLLCNLRDTIAAGNAMTGEAVSTGVRCKFVRAGIDREARRQSLLKASHAELVAELERMTQWHETRIAHIEAGDIPDNSTAGLGIVKVEVHSARAALARAKEIQP